MIPVTTQDMTHVYCTCVFEKVTSFTKSPQARVSVHETQLVTSHVHQRRLVVNVVKNKSFV